MNAIKIFPHLPPVTRFPQLNEIGSILCQLELEKSEQEWTGFLHTLAKEVNGPLGTLGISLQLMQEILDSKDAGGHPPESLRSLSRICGRNFERLEKVIHTLVEPGWANSPPALSRRQ